MQTNDWQGQPFSTITEQNHKITTAKDDIEIHDQTSVRPVRPNRGKKRFNRNADPKRKLKRQNSFRMVPLERIDEFGLRFESVTESSECSKQGPTRK